MFRHGIQNPENCDGRIKNSQGKSWPPVRIPFHDGFDGVTPIYFNTTPPGSKDLVKESEGLPWDSGRYLLDRATFRKWSEYGTPTKGQAAEGKKTQTLGRKRNPKETEIAPGGQSQKESHYSPLDPIPPNGKMAEGEKPKP